MSIVYISSLQSGKDALLLLADAISIDHVVTIGPETAARAQVSGYADFSGLGIPVHHVHEYSMRSPRDVEMVAALAPSLIVVNGWNRLIPPEVLEIPHVGCVGVHGSWGELPFGRGRSPVSWALKQGRTHFFVQLFHLDEGADSGDVIATARFDIQPSDNAGTLLGKVSVASARILTRHIPKILDGTAPRTRQVGEPTYLRRLSQEDARIDWGGSMREVCNLVRAFARPYGGAFGEVGWDGRSVTIRVWKTVPFSEEVRFSDPPGSVVHRIGDQLVVQCGDGAVLVWEFGVEESPAKE